MTDIKKHRVKYITDKNGNKTEVILKIKDYEDLLEDLEDLAVVAERKDEETVNHKQIVKDLKKRNVL